MIEAAVHRIGIVAAMTFAGGCGLWPSATTQNAVPDAGAAPKKDFFIARQIDFKNFRSWPHYVVSHKESADGGTARPSAAKKTTVATVSRGTATDGGTKASKDEQVDPHPVGTRHVYINKLPPHGSEKFPTGTIIVKTTIRADGSEDPHIHAMVKRAGGFNAKGAVGWEWMEIVAKAEKPPVILWRDSRPPSGEGYGDPSVVTSGDCNKCHADAKDNDFVQSDPLTLKGL